MEWLARDRLGGCRVLAVLVKGGTASKLLKRYSASVCGVMISCVTRSILSVSITLPSIIEMSEQRQGALAEC